jgi:hypothetical protein
LGFSEIWKDKFMGNARSLHWIAAEKGFHIPSGYDNIATGLAPTPVSK